MLDGNTVRLKQGDFAQTTIYSQSPLALAHNYEVAGAQRLHLVNLSGAKEGQVTAEFLGLIQRISAGTALRIQTGGGLRSLKDIQATLDAGAEKIVVGTLLFSKPDLVRSALTLFGPRRFIAALDVKGREVRTHGWREGSGCDIDAACRLAQEMGIREILVTDVALDGMEGGPNVELYRGLRMRFPELMITASGGVRDSHDVEALAQVPCDAVVIGKALLNGSVMLKELLEAYPQGSEWQGIIPTGNGLAIRIIPCLDIDEGRVKKGTSFQNLRDAGDPVELAKRYCEEGADELVFLDITATAERRDAVFDLAARVADAVNIPFTVGGGIRSVEDARRLLEAGADKVSINSAAVNDPTLLSRMAEELGRANTVCAIDAKKVGDRWNVLVRGGREDTGIDALEWAEEAVRRGAGELLVTSFDRDGTGEGFDVELLAHVKKRVRVPVIASGGAGTLSSFVDAVNSGNADAVLAASVFHFGTFSIKQVKQALREASYPVRL